MSNLSVSQNNLLLSLDNERIGNPILHHFLLTQGYVQTPEGYVTSNLDYWMVSRVNSFFQQLGWPLDLDNDCKKIIKNFETERVEFETRLTQALEIKRSPVEPGTQLRIPGFQDSVKFKQFQIMPIRHAHFLGNAANFSVPGGGKTCMAYATYFLFRNDPEPKNVEKLLVICPLNAFTTWEEEYTRLTGDQQRKNIVRLHPSSERTRVIQNPTGYDIFLLNYEAVRDQETRDELIDELIGRGLDRTRFLIILDESHKIKNFDSQQSEGVRSLSTFAHRRLILTGTPMPTRWHDLWNQFNFLFPNSNFLETYSTYEARIDNPNFEVEIRRRLTPTWTRVTKSQLDLPASPPKWIPIPMSRIQAQIYETIATQLLIEQARTPWTGPLEDYHGFIWLIEVATDPALIRKTNDFTDTLFSSTGVSIDDLIDDYNKYEKPGKLEAIPLLLAEDWFSKDREKVIIWANFKSTMEKIERICESLNQETRKINGDVAISDRETYLRDFRFDEPDCNILIANPATLSESVSLHMECHRAIYVDRTYNTAHWLQSKERIHRINMPQNAKYYVLMSEFADGGITIDPATGEEVDTRSTIDHLIRARIAENERRMNGFLEEDEIDVHGLDVRYDEDEFVNNGASGDDLATLFKHLREKTIL